MEDLQRNGLTPGQLVVEVTENALLSRSAECARDALDALRLAGVHIALDDFGTGASSLTHLQQLPVAAVKIDRSFVSRVGTNSRSAAIIKIIAALSHELRFDTIAEGVETRDR